MKAIIELAKKPKSGDIVAYLEENLVRVFIDLQQHYRTEIDEEGNEQTVKADGQYDCRSIDTDAKDYGGIVDAVISEKYPISSQYAILANKQLADDPESSITQEKREEYLSDYAEFQTYRQHAKDIAHEVCTKLDLY
jgi:hypothetical protein